jgi:2-oxoglutarate ferredoxin oxidoreductase subunit beta
MDKIMPECWNEQTKPHLFCPGCGHGVVLKQLGYAIDSLNILDKTTLGIDIGCSLLAWNFFNLDTVQTHHGRTCPVMVGYKRVKPKRIALAYMGEGAAYAIGLQSLLHTAIRNEPITIIVVNNENYAMTGGQLSPTSSTGMITSTSPSGKDSSHLGAELHGPELVASVAAQDAYIARVSISNPVILKRTLEEAIKHQVENNAFSFVEVLSICPTNWRTNASSSFEKLKGMENIYPLGRINANN